MRESVGIASIGYYIPEKTLTSREMARISGIPLAVLEDKIGMMEKHVSDENEHPSDMGIAAARLALDKAGVNANQVGIIAYCGASFYDYRIWSPAARIQNALGAEDCYAFEVKNGCNGGNLGINICKSLLLSHKEKKYALVVCSEKLSPYIDYTDSNSLSLFMVGDGAAAALIEKSEIDAGEEAANRICSYASITEGSTADCVKVPLGGTRIPSPQHGDKRCGYICVQDPAGLDRIFSETYLENYVKVIERAVRMSRCSLSDIDLLFTNQVKRSLSQDIFRSVALGEEKTLTSIRDYGHMGTVDTLFNLARAWEGRMVKPGCLAVMASSGAGFTWAALALKFHRP